MGTGQVVTDKGRLITLNRTFHLKDLAEARRLAIMAILIIDPNVKIHLLGLNTFEELDFYKIYSDTVVSIDTGAPYTNALNRRRFGEDTLAPKQGFSIDYSAKWNDTDFAEACFNISYLRKRLNSVQQESLVHG
ncbi:MAG: hypothetical protein IIC67_09600 [Thaumarchaeota archaeon]|nr:hypothetical protein [Nitrososphaerota archaeon]